MTSSTVRLPWAWIWTSTSRFALLRCKGSQISWGWMEARRRLREQVIRRPSLRHAQFPQQIAAGLPHHGISALDGAVRARVGAGRYIYWTETLVLEQSLDAEDM